MYLVKQLIDNLSLIILIV